MNELATIEPASTPAPCLEDWIATGRSLAAQKNNLDWQIADWVSYGRANFPEQMELALAYVTDDPRKLRRIELTVEAFPPATRHAALTFDHHSHVADMPRDEALTLLKIAGENKMSAREIRMEAIARKIDTGQISPRDDDPDYDHMLALSRAWNRAPANVRIEFADMIRDSAGGVIDV